MKHLFLTIFVIIVASCSNSHPNLLILHTDQQSRWTVGAYGDDELRGPLTTPNIDRLAADGILFTNFFTNSAVCSPSRALMMTGCYAPKNGVSTNNLVLNDIPTLADLLNESGYITGYAGKWHLSGKPRPGWAPDSYGWTDNRFMFNRGHYKKITEEISDYPKEHPYKEIGDEENYTTDWLTRKTIDFIRAHQAEKFAFMVSYPDPHQPWAVREPFNSMYEPAEMTIPASFSQTIDPLTTWHKNMVEQYGILDSKKLKRIKSMYSGSVHLIDHNIGLILSEIEQLGLNDHTVVVFTTDHGEYMGEHGMLYKNNFFEAAYHLPLIIRDPRRDGGEVNSHFISMVDFMPGILNLVGIDPPEAIDGRDFAITFSESDWTEEVQVHHSNHSGAGIYTPDYYLLLHQSGEHLLIDRMKDPYGLFNLYYDPDFEEILDELTARILTHHELHQTGEWKSFLRPKFD